MSNVTTLQTTTPPVKRDELITVLGSSLYVGAKPESIGMILDYCAAAKLDPMQKPVHIVPMSTKNPVTGNYEWRDVVMPGIGLYRIQADRSGTMAGISAPEYGPDITRTFTDKNGKEVTVTFPEWCKIAVKKLVGNHIVEFVAQEYWLENYATDSSKSDAPNTMWRKRSRGQLAKCSEAQALRKAFPEVGAQPTAEEMEGKVIEISEVSGPANETIETEVVEEFMDQKRFAGAYEKSWKNAISTGKMTPQQVIDFAAGKGNILSPDQIKTLNETEGWGE